MPTRRIGVEWTNDYRLVSWFDLDADVADTRARFLGYDRAQAALYYSLAGFPEAQIGNGPGNYVPGTATIVGSINLTLGEKTGRFGGLVYRYFGRRPLTEDGACFSPATGLLSARVGYTFDNGWTIQLDGLNITDNRSDQITYAYGSLLKTDALYHAMQWADSSTHRGLPEWRHGPHLQTGRAIATAINARWQTDKLWEYALAIQHHLARALTVVRNLAWRRRWAARSGIFPVSSPPSMSIRGLGGDGRASIGCAADRNTGRQLVAGNTSWSTDYWAVEASYAEWRTAGSSTVPTSAREPKSAFSVLWWRPNCLARRLVYALPNEKGPEL
ncbi:MAG: TonB-dependent receptor [Methylocella sp.]